MTKTNITNTFYKSAAYVLSVEVAALRAVEYVETGGKSGFLPDGRPRILFEAHWFDRLTKGKYRTSHPNISSRKWNRKLYKGPKGEYKRFNKAFALDPDAAIKSASWGAFQIMGFNYLACGCKSPKEFRQQMILSSGEQFLLLCYFLESKGLHHYLRSHDWDKFAMGYNGPAYKKNKYAKKLKKAYLRFIR